MRTAILGAGTIVPDFLEAASGIEELEICAIFGQERDLPAMREWQDRYGIAKIYSDYDRLLADEAVQAVYVALPNHLHYAFAKKALEHKKHVLVEKPFASSAGEARRLAETAKANRVVVFEAISNLYTPNYRKTRELIKELGNVKIVQLNYSQYSRRYDLFKEGIVLPVFDPKKSGGALMDLNVYNIHYIVGLFGKPERVRYLANVERGIDTSGILTLEYPGFLCVSIGAKDCRAPVSVSIQGDRGCIYSDCPANGYNSFTFALNDGKEQAFALNGGAHRLYYELKEFVEITGTGDLARAEARCRHTLDVMEILDEGRRQAGIRFEGKED